MQAGLIGKWERLRYTLTASPTGTGVYTLSATLRSRHARNLSDFLQIALLEIAVSRTEAGEERTLFTAQWLSNTYTFTADDASGGSLRMEWIQPRWYMRAVGADEEWYFTWQGVEVYRGGTLVASWAGGSYSVVLGGFRYKAPAAAPLLLVQLTAGASAGYPTPPTQDAWSYSSSARIVASGGWEVREGGQWRRFPVRLEVERPLSAPCDLTLNQSPVMSASDTASASLTARASASYQQTDWATVQCYCVDERGRSGQFPFISRYRDVYVEGESETAQVWLIPNLPREFVRLISPTASLIYRAKLPKCSVGRSTAGSRTRLQCGGDQLCSDTNSDTLVKYPFADEFLGVLRDSSHALEDPLRGELLAPYEWQYEWSYSHTRPVQPVQPGDCPQTPIGGTPITYNHCMCPEGHPLRFQAETKSVRAFVGFPQVESNQCLPYYEHEEAVPRYFNTRCNPFWSYFLWFADWALGVPLTPVSRVDYWLPLQQQWLYHPRLPAGDATKQRNLCCLEPLTVSPHRDWVETDLLGVPTLWAGACRFDTMLLPDVEQVQLSSSSSARWSATNATLSFTGTGIVVVPLAATSTLEFDLTDWQIPPYLYPALCTAVRVELTGVVQSVQVFLVNFEGDAQLLEPDPNDRTKYLYRAGRDSVYAGDWAQGYHALLFPEYVEVGHDVQASGRSSSVMSDPAKRTLWELLHSQTPAKLRIVVRQLAPAPYTLAYPIFYRSHSESKAYPLTAHTQAVVDHDALWRYGGLNFQLATPVPQLRPVHQSPTVYDAFCLRNLLYRGVAYQQDVVADAQALYDDVEWTGQLADLRTDTRSLVYPLRARQNPPEPLLILINAYREVPPVVCLPRRKRPSDTLQETGDFGQWQYLISPLRRYLVSLDAPLHMHRVEYDSQQQETGRQVLTSFWERFRRAHITYHELALDNDEVLTAWNGQSVNSPRYHLHLGGQDYARATPFHGYSAVIWQGQQADAWLSIARQSAFRVARAYRQGEQLIVGYARDAMLQDWEEHTVSLAGIQPCLCYLPAAQGLLLAVSESGQVKLYRQTREGGAWQLVITVANGTHPTLLATSDGRLFAYYYREGAIYGKQVDVISGTTSSEFIAISRADDAEIDSLETVIAHGKSLIALIYRQGGQVKVATSWDGKRFG